MGRGGGVGAVELVCGSGVCAAFAPDDFDVLAPALVDGEEVPVYAGGEVAEDDLCGGVDAEGGGDEVQAGLGGGEAEAGEVAVALEVAEGAGGVGVFCVVMADSDPVVEALEGELGIFFSFELDDCEAAFCRDGEEVKHAAICCGEGGDLGVDVVRVKGVVQRGRVATDEAFQPAFRLQAVEDVGFGAGRVSALA